MAFAYRPVQYAEPTEIRSRMLESQVASSLPHDGEIGLPEATQSLRSSINIPIDVIASYRFERFHTSLGSNDVTTPTIDARMVALKEAWQGLAFYRATLLSFYWLFNTSRGNVEIVTRFCSEPICRPGLSPFHANIYGIYRIRRRILGRLHVSLLVSAFFLISNMVTTSDTGISRSSPTKSRFDDYRARRSD